MDGWMGGLREEGQKGRAGGMEGRKEGNWKGGREKETEGGKDGR